MRVKSLPVLSGEASLRCEIFSSRGRITCSFVKAKFDSCLFGGKTRVPHLLLHHGLVLRRDKFSQLIFAGASGTVEFIMRGHPKISARHWAMRHRGLLFRRHLKRIDTFH